MPLDRVLVSAGAGYLAAVAAIAGFLVAQGHVRRRKEKLKGQRPVRVADRPFSDGAHEKILKAVEVAEPLSEEEMAELDDFMLFEDLAEDKGWIDAGLEWAVLHAAWQQLPEESIARMRDEWENAA